MLGGKPLNISDSPVERLELVIEFSWKLLFAKIMNSKVNINKEASLQLQLAKVMQEIGTSFCILPNEVFEIELETGRGKANIDVTCKLGKASAAVELKCFKKSSNRATDLDMYDALKDIERLDSFVEYDLRFFICLTDNPYYS
jgi:hypothetical protein